MGSFKIRIIFSANKKKVKREKNWEPDNKQGGGVYYSIIIRWIENMPAFSSQGRGFKGVWGILHFH